jgi:hypothetical protein
MNRTKKTPNKKVPAVKKASRKGAKARSKTLSHAAPKRPTRTVIKNSSQDFHTLGELDLHLFGEGKHERIYEKLGAHVSTEEGVPGVAFAVWAPNAKSVSVVGNFNEWNGSKHRMHRLGS